MNTLLKMVDPRDGGGLARIAGIFIARTHSIIRYVGGQTSKPTNEQEQEGGRRIKVAGLAAV